MTLDFEHDGSRRGLGALSPAQGWFALLMVVAMCLALASSLDDAVLVLGDGKVTDFLTWTAVAGVLIGVLGPTVGWGRWTTHLIGALFAALVTPMLVGWILLEGHGNAHALFVATADSAVIAWSDLVVNHRLSTFQYGHHLLVLGLIVWASSQFASYAAFGHRRPLNAVIVIGLLLLANMSLTTRGQLPYLVLYSVAALFLLVRFHTFDERSDWLRRRIGDPSAISGLYLRGGTVFIVAAVVGSLLLTNIASSKPLAGAWTDVGGRLLELSRAIEPFLPASGSGRSIGPSFGENARITGSWVTSDVPALRIEVATTEHDLPYIAAVVYHQFDQTGWRRNEPILSPRAADEPLLTGTADEVPTQGRRELTMTITPLQAREEVFTPTMPLSVDVPADVRLLGNGDRSFFQGLRREPSTGTYTVTALVPASEKDGGPTEALLREAGTVYPAEISALYGSDSVSDDALGDASRALLAEIRTASGPRATPYDLAATTMSILKDPARFEYDTDVRDQPCDDISIVECFARIKRGYCEYYASTMAVLLREMGVPTRLIEGFLPGRRELGTGESLVRFSDSHAWVQVWFPGYGWIDFDPTGAVATLAPLPSGRPDARASAGASGSAAPVTRRPESAGPSERDIGGGGTTGPRPPGAAGPMIAIAILLAAIVAAFAAVAWQRGPRGPISAEGTYGSVTRLASRFGFAPRPNQTVYEFAGALGDVLPMARPELETVARAKVEVAYGGRVLTDDRMRSLREAHRRLRIAMLRLLARRVRRRQRR